MLFRQMPCPCIFRVESLAATSLSALKFRAAHGMFSADDVECLPLIFDHAERVAGDGPCLALLVEPGLVAPQGFGNEAAGPVEGSPVLEHQREVGSDAGRGDNLLACNDSEHPLAGRNQAGRAHGWPVEGHGGHTVDGKY